MIGRPFRASVTGMGVASLSSLARTLLCSVEESVTRTNAMSVFADRDCNSWASASYASADPAMPTIGNEGCSTLASFSLCGAVEGSLGFGLARRAGFRKTPFGGCLLGDFPGFAASPMIEANSRQPYEKFTACKQSPYQTSIAVSYRECIF